MKIISLIFALTFPFFLLGQSQQLKLQATENTITLKKQLEIDLNNTLVIKKKSNSFGVQHTKYQQLMDGFPIIGANFVTHAHANAEMTVNGHWVKQFSRKGAIQISAKEAIDRALLLCGNECLFYWEVPRLEKRLKESNSKRESFYPNPKLVWYSKEKTNAATYRLAYEMDVFVYQPRAKYKYYIDAETGKVLHRYNNIQETNVPANGTTNYAGEVSIVADSLAPSSFQLKEEKRQGHTNITTANYKTEEVVSDANNVWGETGEELDRTAVDVHWGIEKTIDFFQDFFERQGMDNMGRDIIAYVHDEDANAYYDGESITFGDGDPEENIGPLTAIIVVAHEFTHGITESEADLYYEGESGGINESMSDVFGVAVEHYVNPTGYNWALGEEFNYTIRRMDDPKSLEMADTYEGEFWMDDEDVHALSSIGNFWYYLLVEGGSGTNDKNYTYALAGVGFDTATAIVYDALTNYLTSYSDYADYRSATLEVTKNMFGDCSPALFSVANTWAAVGIGTPLRNNDLRVDEIISPKSSCNLTDSEAVSVQLIYSSCPDKLVAGSIIKMHYTLNGNNEIIEDFEIPTTLSDNDTLTFIFTKKVDCSTLTNEINVWLENPNDEYTTNDHKSTLVENNALKSADFGIAYTKGFAPFQCSSKLNTFKLGIQYIGCEQLPVGTAIPVHLSFGSLLNEELSLEVTESMSNGDTLALEIESTLVNTTNLKELKIELSYPNDPEADNNSILLPIVYGIPALEIAPFYFNNSADLERLYISRGPIFQDFPIEIDAASLLISGGDLSIPEIPLSKDDVWNINKDLISDVSICIDATGKDSVLLRFDIHQETDPSFFEWLDLGPPLYCNMRLKANGQVISPTYFVDNTDYAEGFIHEKYDLSDYAGSIFSLTFETQNLLPPFFGSDGETGDDIRLDNIFVELLNTTATTESIKNNLQVETSPNPTNNSIDLKFVFNQTEHVEYSLYNTKGQNLLTGNFTVFPAETKQLDLSTIKSGVYFLKINTGSESGVVRVVKF